MTTSSTSDYDVVVIGEQPCPRGAPRARALRRRVSTAARTPPTRSSSPRGPFQTPRTPALAAQLDPGVAAAGDVEVATVIRATGFVLDHSWVHVPVFAADGTAVHTRAVTASPGLHFLGLSWMHTRGRAARLGVEDAAYIAEQIRMRAQPDIGHSS